MDDGREVRAPSAPGDGSDSLPRILIVDDDRNFLRVLRYQISQIGLEVESAASGADALAVLSRKPIHLLLTDLRMPGMDGRELIREVRRLHPAMPAVILTAHTFMCHEQSDLPADVVWLGKPPEVDTLFNVILDALQTNHIVPNRHPSGLHNA